ncbi:hypothetical protein [Amycolatopsis sp. NPDC050768]
MAEQTAAMKSDGADNDSADYDSTDTTALTMKKAATRSAGGGPFTKV